MDKVIKETLEYSAGKISESVASFAFDVWQRKDFRLYVNFPNITQTEQDRIFNELEVSILGLLILKIDYFISEEDKEFAKVLLYFRSKLIEGFLNIFRNLKVEEKLVKQWEKLIDLRLKEYKEHFAIAIKESAKAPEFKKDKQYLRIDWARIETITIDCLSHIRRGRIEENDPLWKFLRKWFIDLEGKFSPLTDAIVSGRR